MTTPTDIIDRLAGIKPGSAVAALAAARSTARENAQASYRLLLEPAEPGAVSIVERRAVAAFVARLTGDDAAAEFYDGRLREVAGPALVQTIGREARAGTASGPYGRFPQGPLSVEDEDGNSFAVSGEGEEALGGKLSRALEHAHLLVLHPRDANAAALQRLFDAGWSEDAVVTLSQLVAFLSFQIRAAIGLRALARNPAAARAVA